MTTSSKKSYFDLHITGLGYLNRIREVKPKKGEAFLACNIAALNGPSDSPEYCYYDVKVSGSDAQHLIRRCIDAVDAKRKVLIGFKLGDPWIDLFTYSKGPKEGQTGASQKARLLFVSWIKIDGRLEYKAESKTADDGAGEDSHATSSPPDKGPSSEPAQTDAEVPADAPAQAA
jgi:hypothetical protein